MSTKWKHLEKVNVLLKSLESYLEHQPDGSVAYTSLRHQDDIPALTSLAKFTQEIPQEHQERIVRTAIAEAKKLGNLHHGRVGEAIKREEALYLQRPLQRYSLLTTISIHYSNVINPVKFQKTYITFHKDCPKAYDISPIMNQATGLIQGKFPFWWDPLYQIPKKPLDLNKAYNSLKAYEKSVRRYISKSKYGPYIKKALIKYAHALDDPDMSGAFMKLWNVLEYATRTRKAENFITTIKRVLFIFKKDKQYHEIHLDELREERNRMAHQGSQSQRGHEALFQLMLYANAMLTFLIEQSCRFESPDEFADFLDMPSDEPEMKKKEEGCQQILRDIRYIRKLLDQ